MAIKKFLLHYGGYPYTSSGTEMPLIEFARAVTTVDPTGASVGTEMPRFDVAVMFPSITTPENVLTSATNINGDLLASGVGLDGSTPVMLWLHRSEASGEKNALYGFVGGSVPTSIPVQSGSPPSGHFRRILTPRTCNQLIPSESLVTFYDVLANGEQPTLNGRKLAFEVKDASIFHGAIVLACQVYIEQAESPFYYEICGFGFVLLKLNTSDGIDLVGVIGHDLTSGSPTTDDQLGWPRGAYYCIRAAPIYERDESTPLTCWFSGTDYRGSVAGPAGKGRVYVFKLTRPNGSTAWSAPYGSSSLKIFEVATPLTHAHTAQIVEYNTEEDPPGLQLIASIGDGSNHNRFIRYRLNSINSNYMTATWTTSEDYHGTHVSSGFGSFSAQPAAACFGPKVGTIIWGTDTTNDWIFQMNLPLTGTDQCNFQHIYGLRHCVGAPTSIEEAFIPILSTIKDERPELASEMMPDPPTAPAAAWILGPEAMNRVIYTPHVSSEGDSWMQVAALRLGSVTVVSYGDYIYWNRIFGNGGFKRVPKPDFRRLRPVIVSPGGTNLAISGCDYGAYFLNTSNPVDTTVEVDECPFSSGAYYDPDTDEELPPPPCKPARVFRVKTRTTATATRPASIGTFLVSKAGSQTLSWISGQDSPALVRRWRFWVLDGSLYNPSALSPNKTTYMTMSQIDFNPAVNAEVRYSCADRWCPLAVIARRPVAAGVGSVEYEFPIDAIASGSGEAPDDNYAYVAIDMALDGNGSLPFPLAPASGTSPPTIDPEELAVTGLGLDTANNWRIRIAGMHPIGDWDHYAMRGSISNDVYVSNRRWPLFHLWADSTHYIEFVADCENRRYLARIKDGAGTPAEIAWADGLIYWMPDAPLYVTIAWDASNKTLKIGASSGGDQVRIDELGGLFGSTPVFTELRFRAATGEVVTYRWAGGDYDNDLESPLTDDQIEAEFESLEFLDDDE